MNVKRVSIKFGPAGCMTMLAIVVVWLFCVCAAILASSVLVDALYHLGHWLLGW